MTKDQRAALESPSWLRHAFSGPDAGVAVFLVIVCALMSFVSPNFLSWLNFRNVINQSVFTMILAVGMTAVLIGGGIDLSVGAVVGLCAGVSAWLIESADFPLALALLSGLIVGTCLGLLNAAVIMLLGIPDFIATLAMLGFASGILYVWTNGVPFIGYAGPGYMLIGGLGRLFWWITAPEVVAAAVICTFAVLVNATRFGRHLRASGENAEVARLSGVNVARMKGDGLRAVWLFGGAGRGHAGGSSDHGPTQSGSRDGAQRPGGGDHGRDGAVGWTGQHPRRGARGTDADRDSKRDQSARRSTGVGDALRRGHHHRRDCAQPSI